VIRFSSPRLTRDEICERACSWLARLDAGASAADLEDLGRWLNENPAHVDMLMKMAELWDQTSVLSELSVVFPLKEYAPVPKDKTSRWARFVPAMAMMMVVVLGSFAIANYLKDTAANPPSASMSMQQQYATAVGEQLTVNLPDGSEIILNTNTRLSVAYSAAVRDIVLERGEGHFSVASDPDRPFRVHAGASVVEAIGTAFVVQRDQPGNVEVIVTEGKVSFTHDQVAAADDAAPETVVAGESLLLDEQSNATEKSRMQSAEIEVKLAWRHGMLLFQGDSLESVLKEVSRYTSVRIEADDAIKDIQVEGYFPAGNVDALLLAVSESLPIDIRRISDQYYVLTSRQQE
jgi:transmembrane sensor